MVWGPWFTAQRSRHQSSLVKRLFPWSIYNNVGKYCRQQQNPICTNVFEAAELQWNWAIFTTAPREKEQTQPSDWAVVLVWTHNHSDPWAPLPCPELKRAVVICFAYISSDNTTLTAAPDPRHKSLLTKGCLAGQILNSTTFQASQKISSMALQTSWSTKALKGFIYWKKYRVKCQRKRLSTNLTPSLDKVVVKYS